MPVSEVSIDRAIIERAPDSLYQFVKMAWPVVEHAIFTDGRILEEVCDHLQAVSEGHIKQLILNQPPGTTKSLTACVFWPVWDWIQHPERKWIYASYDPSLTRRDANRSLHLLSSTWFIKRWGFLLRDQNSSASEYFTKSGGMRFATSVKGKATGRHADIQVVDDPIKPKDALGGANASSVSLDECLAWWTQTMATRVTDAKRSARVIIMQRIHENDLAGHMIRDGGYTHLCLPMRYDEKRRCITSYSRTLPSGRVEARQGGDWRSTENELLWPERFDQEAVERLCAGLRSPAAISAQLEQRPTPRGGLIFKEAWFRYWHPKGGNMLDPNGKPCSPLPKRGLQIQSWDMNFKGGEGSSRVSGGVWLREAGKFYLLSNDTDVHDFVSTLAAVKRMTKEFPLAIEKIVENKANGQAVINMLQGEVPGLVGVEPSGGKVDRANASAHLFKSGFVFLPHPELAPWMGDYVAELSNFPFGKNDDQVDMTTQALIHLQANIVEYEEAMRTIQ